MPGRHPAEEVEVVAATLMRRRHRARVENIAMPAEKTLGLSEQLACRPGKRCQDARLFHLRFPEWAANCLLRYGASPYVDYCHRHCFETSIDEIEPSLQSDPVLLRRHGDILRLRHAVLDIP